MRGVQEGVWRRVHESFRQSIFQGLLVSSPVVHHGGKVPVQLTHSEGDELTRFREYLNSV
ncbi:hypothetical protein EON65_50660 [archaeon]|nr:MAG: hypothetical protein EON65_50660 [archaeon]